MRYFLFFLFFFSISLVYSQESAGFEKGIGPFRFGDPTEKYSGQIRLILTMSFGQNYYAYQGMEANNLYDHRTNKVNLGFENERLFYIDLYFEGFDDEDFKALRQSLEKEYGESFHTDEPFEEGIDQAFRWDTANALMQLTKYNEEAVEFGDRNQTVLMLSLKDD